MTAAEPLSAWSALASSPASFSRHHHLLTVAGEEQGLYGSGHFAKMAKAQGWNLEACWNNDSKTKLSQASNKARGALAYVRARAARAGRQGAGQQGRHAR